LSRSSLGFGPSTEITIFDGALDLSESINPASFSGRLYPMSNTGTSLDLLIIATTSSLKR
jgi:hypothetical protein